MHFFLLALLGLTACCGPRAGLPQNVGEFGIDPVALRLTANGTMLDLRYRVTDPQRAADLLDRSHSVYLLHEPSGKVLPVPVMAKLGPMRQITRNPKPGKVYFILFSNGGELVRSGDLATLVLGDKRLRHLRVE